MKIGTGKYEILFPVNDEKVFIINGEGEELEFSKKELYKKLEEAIDKIFKENF